MNGSEYTIRSDFRAVLDVLAILDDPELTDAERGSLAFEVFYPAYDDMPACDYQQAAEFLQWFVGGGDMPKAKQKAKLADWKQDFPLIINPVNRVLGFEARAVEYLHWWTFLSAYYEIGDCMFAQVVAIRKKKRSGKKLDKWEREFYNENRELIDFNSGVSDSEQAIIDEWMGGVGNG